ncbi:MAG TPA: MerR family transcriptional regulator [Egibacteraceae bacterium]
MGYTVGEVAKLSGVTVRALHHYDEVGLLRPSGRTAAGYRRYELADLERLQRILCYRELEFSLDDIKTILDDPDADALEHLRRQRELVTQRIGRLERLVTTLEKTMEARQMGIDLTPEELFEVFGEQDPTQYAEETEQRYGDSDAYAESQRRTSRYRKDDWQRILAEQEQVTARLAEAMSADLPADSEEAMDAAEAHRQHISRWYYDCTYEIHRGLGDMYVSDPRFTAHYEKHAPGLAAYVRDAIVANAERAGA